MSTRQVRAKNIRVLANLLGYLVQYPGARLKAEYLGTRDLVRPCLVHNLHRTEDSVTQRVPQSIRRLSQ